MYEDQNNQQTPNGQQPGQYPPGYPPQYPYPPQYQPPPPQYQAPPPQYQPPTQAPPPQYQMPPQGYPGYPPYPGQPLPPQWQTPPAPPPKSHFGEFVGFFLLLAAIGAVLYCFIALPWLRERGVVSSEGVVDASRELWDRGLGAWGERRGNVRERVEEVKPQVVEPVKKARETIQNPPSFKEVGEPLVEPVRRQAVQTRQTVRASVKTVRSSASETAKKTVRTVRKKIEKPSRIADDLLD